MKNRIRIICCLFHFDMAFTMSFIHAQDLTGIWRGHFRSNDGLERLTGNSTVCYRTTGIKWKYRLRKHIIVLKRLPIPIRALNFMEKLKHPAP